MKVYVDGRAVVLKPGSAIGAGGEAEVFDVGGGRALKLFKPPDHPDFAADPWQRTAAEERLAERQHKLRRFPAGLPPRIVVPEKLATTRDGGQVLGYTMRLLAGAEPMSRYGERAFRQVGVPSGRLPVLFRDLHATLTGLHAAGIVVGDLNDLNVLVEGTAPHLIDADSFQFPPFLCRAFTERFVDPLLCDAAAGRPLLVRAFTPDSDWYAYAVMLMRSLLFVDPYGGVFKPAGAAPRIAAPARPLHRITVFHPQVRYPRTALRLDTLPDELLDHFQRVFVADRRGAFPHALLDALRFTRCAGCGIEHARASCPACIAVAAGLVREVTTVRGRVLATRAFRTRGTILCASLDDGGLRVLVHEDGALKREDGSVVLEGDPAPGTRFAVAGRRTFVARSGLLLSLAPDAPAERRNVEGAGFAAQGGQLYWVESGSLRREGTWGAERIGDVLAARTSFWVGPEFGFGFYRAGDLQVAFVFAARGRGINDRVAWPRVRGHLVDARCLFGQGRAWFFTAGEDGGRRHHRCLVVRPDGAVEASAEAEPGDGSWLADLDGKCAAGRFLLAATEDGLCRLEVDQGRIVKTKEFPDAEPFLDPGCTLLAGNDGLYVVDRQEVRRLRIA
jgi:hypothetical protein